MRRSVLAALLIAVCAGALTAGAEPSPELSTEIRRITSGPAHHFFGYIGHVRTIPWSGDGRWIVALQTQFQERMPLPGEPAEIVLLDTRNDYAPRVVDRSRAWNPQQGTMLYWNPQAPDTQFFFNDRDPQTQKVFCVLFDLSKGERGERVAEYRFADGAIGNSGVAQHGGTFLGLNYARLARLRPVTGYPGARDWTTGVKHPADDGVFRIDTRTRKKRLLVSFRQLAELLRPTRPDVDTLELFINHTLWSRDDRKIFFFVRAEFDNRQRRLDVPFVMDADGGHLQPLARHIGGHPDWESGRRLIGLADKQQILFDVERQEVAGTLGPPGLFPNPGGDVALSPDGKWFVNGHGEGGKNYYTVLRRSDHAWTRTTGIDQGGYIGGNLRIDPSPCWNRDSTAFLAPGIADDERKTRQLYLITVKSRRW